MKKTLFALIILTFSLAVSAQVRTDFDRKMNAPTEPFTIFENIHYVGTDDLAIFLITTPRGHILIDAGFRETVPQIKANIEKLGFKFTDIKILLTNHTHPDHAGGLATIKELTEARVYASKRQKKQLKRGGRKDFRFGDENTFDKVKVDRLFQNEQRIRLGGVTILPLFTPGHTKGCVSFLTRIRTKEGNYEVMFAGSLTSLDYDFVDNKKYKKHAKEFQETFDLMRTLKVDIFLTSHAQFFKMKEKRELLKKKPAMNPFFDPAGYLNYVLSNEKSFQTKLKKQREAN